MVQLLNVKYLSSFFDRGVMTYKILHDLCPDNLRHKLTERSQISNNRTSNCSDLQIARVRLMQREVSTFLVSLTGMISLTAIERQSQSLVSLESINWTFKHKGPKHKPLVEKQFILSLSSFSGY